MIELPRSLEFAIIMAARKKGNYLGGLFRPVFHFDDQVGWVTQPTYIHSYDEAGRLYRLKSLKMAVDKQSLSFTVQKIDNS